MIKYLQTTTIILAWVFVFAYLWALLAYKIKSSKKIESASDTATHLTLVPSLVLTPITLLLAYKVFGWNLIFPVHFATSFTQLLIAAIPPAIILSLACGLPVLIWRQMHTEIYRWQLSPFVRYGEACGLSSSRVMRKLVFTKVVNSSWLICMPWLFGELIVIEALFNAPGLALDAWHQARMRNFNALTHSISSLGLLYGICLFLGLYIHRWLGTKLESY